MEKIVNNCTDKETDGHGQAYTCTIHRKWKRIFYREDECQKGKCELKDEKCMKNFRKGQSRYEKGWLLKKNTQRRSGKFIDFNFCWKES